MIGPSVDLADLRSVVALVVTFGLGGWLLGLAFVPERIGLERRAWLSLALAVPATVVVGAPSIASHDLTGRSFAIWLAVLGAVAAWRCRERLLQLARLALAPRAALLRLRPVGRRSARRIGWTATLVVAAALIGWATVLGPQVRAVGSDNLPQGTIVWYYWRLAQEVFQARDLPETIVEWGAPRPFPHEYLVTTLHTATTAVLAGAPDLALMEGYRLTVVALALLAACALWRRWLPGWWAWLAAILTLSATRLSSRLVGYRPETFGLVLVLWSGWLLDEALERRSPRWGVLAGLVSASAFLAHAEVWLVTGPLWLGIVLSRVLRARRGTAVVAIATAGAFLLATLASQAATGGLARLGELVDAPATQRDGDPTWAFYAAIFGLDTATHPPPDDFWDPRLQSPSSRQPYPGVDLAPGPIAALLAAAALLAVAELRRRPAGARRGLAVWVVYVLGVLVGAALLWALYDTYVPARAGPKRIMPLYVLGLAGGLAALGWSLAGRLFRAWLAGGVRRSARLRHRTAAGAAMLVTTLSLLVIFTPLVGGTILDEDRGVSPTGYAAYLWIRDNLPPDAVVLANAYTEGSLGAITGRTGWLDGRAPYLEDPSFLEAATAALLDARRYFAAPKRLAGLRPGAVDYLLVAHRAEDLGGYAPFKVDRDALSRAPDLRLVRSFADGALLLYQVIRDDT